MKADAVAAEKQASASGVDLPFNNVTMEKRMSENVAEVVLDGEAHHNVVKELKALYDEHVHDFNFPHEMLQRASSLINHDSSNIDREQARTLLEEFNHQKQLLLNDSPYPEVRAVVDPTDDPSLPVNTFRVWFLGTIIAILGTGIDQFFSLRFPAIFVASYAGQLAVYPMGMFLAKVLPSKKISLGALSFTLNPGPFNQKEHMLITIMSNVAYGGYNGTAYMTSIIQALDLEMFYGNRKLSRSAGFQILLALSTQLIGYGSAGITRRILVYPAEMIWPKSLAQIALNKALHHDDGSRELSSGWNITRYRFFLVTFGCMFLYFWLPNYLFNALSTFNWITWISPNNVKLAIITGGVCGLGINPIPTFDWNQVAALVDPIVTPFFGVANLFFGMFVAVVFVTIPIYWTNAKNTAYLPINSPNVFDNTGNLYNISRVLNAQFSLDEAAYEAYSPPYLPATTIVVYACYFAVYTACVVHSALYNRREITRGFKNIFNLHKSGYEMEQDVHSRLMRSYKEAPEWWYAVMLAVSFVMACCCCALWDTSMPIWGVVFAVVLCFVIQVPVGIILASSNTEVTLNVIAEFIGGYALNGKPIANMLFKAYGYIACAQSIQFSADLKLAHYSKIPPRLTFAAQTWATVVAAFVSIGVNQWQLLNIKGICEPDQPEKFSCPDSHVFFAASVIWGAIGPQRIFGAGQLYTSLGWGFLAGVLLPIPFYFLQKRFPGSWVRYVHIPVILSGPLYLSPYNLMHLWPGFVVSLCFNHFIKNRWLGWWQRYAYVLTSAMSAAVGMSAILMFFAVQFQDKELDWWGNSVSYAGVDGGDESACVLKTVPPGGF